MTQTTAYPLPRPVAIVRAYLSVKSKMSWSETFLKLLKDNDVRLITYVPDNVLTPLIAGVNADNYFLAVTATREDEAIGTVSGAYMAGLRGAVMMQTSGFALIANALASLVLPYQIPVVMVISERGTLGEFNALDAKRTRQYADRRRNQR